MYRGTTPTLTFKLPIQTGQITALSVAIKQDGVLRLDKGLEDVTMDGDTISLTLTEDETLALRASENMPCKVQLRVGVGDTRMASQVFEVAVDEILRDGAL
mgnify:FL=1